MRFGLCGSMVAIEPDKTGVEVVEKLKAAGYDYIELSLVHMTAMSNEAFDRLKYRVGGSGLRCESCNNFYPPELRLTGHGVDWKKVKTYTEYALDRAGQLGAKIIVFGSGPAKKLPEGFPRQEGWKQLVQLLSFVSEAAVHYGITAVIEPLRKTECNIINNIGEAARLAKEVNCSNIKVLADLFHLSMESEDLSILLDNKDYINHVHFANPNGRVFPKSIDEYDYLLFINSLKKIGYKGRVSIEAYTDNFDRDAAPALEFCRMWLAAGWN